MAASKINVRQGGTGASTFTDGGVLVGNGTGALQSTSAGTAGQVLTSNGAGVDPTFQAAGGGSGEAISKAITQTAHGFSVGDVVKFSGSTYQKAKADTAANAEVVGIVSVVAGANDFTLLESGYIGTLSGLTSDSTYFLSDATAGLLTLTEPTAVGSISEPLLKSVSTTTGYFMNMRGMEITAAGASAIWTLMETLTFTASSTTQTTANFTNATTAKEYMILVDCNTSAAAKFVGFRCNGSSNNSYDIGSADPYFSGTGYQIATSWKFMQTGGSPSVVKVTGNILIGAQESVTDSVPVSCQLGAASASGSYGVRGQADIDTTLTYVNNISIVTDDTITGTFSIYQR